MASRKMYKRLLVPLDGSELSRRALVPARALASGLDLEVLLLYVAHPDEPDLIPMFQSYIEHEAEALAFGELGGRLKARGEVMGGYAADGILRYAELNGIDLIMLTSHGRSGFREFVIGSVADRVLRATKTPVWLVKARREQRNAKLKKVLVPLDGSLLAESVLAHVRALSSAPGSAIEATLLRVSEPPVSLNPPVALDWSRLIEEHLLDVAKVAETYLASAVVKLGEAGIKINTEVIVGEPAAEIVSYAARKGSDLIAIASHGHSGITRWAYGNIAGRVVNGAPCDVLFIQPG